VINRPPDAARRLKDLAFLSAALSLAAIIPLLGLPVYFRTDDVHWLGWAASHPNPLAAFDPGQNLFGYYRPLPTILWWVLFRLFGFEPLGYQLVLAALGVGAMWPLNRIGRRITGLSSGGLVAVALFHAAFVSILYFYYWFSALTFALEILLLVMALDALTDGPDIPGRPIRFVVFSLLAGLAKQPALLVIPAVAITMLLQSQRGMRHRWAWGAGILFGAIALMLVTPFVAQRPEALGQLAAGERVGYLVERLRFYATVLLQGPAGPLAMAAASVAVARHRLGLQSMAALLAVLAAGLMIGLGVGRLDPVFGILPWLTILLTAAMAVPESRPWLVGFLVPAVALLGVDFHVSTYLLEPALVLTPAILLWCLPLVRPAAQSIEDRVPRRAWKFLPILMPLLAAVSALFLHGWLAPVVTMRHVRAVFRQAVETIRDTAPANTVVGYLSYEELGATYADIRQAPLDQRVERHKTMNGSQLAKFLRLQGRPDLHLVAAGEIASEADSLAGYGPAWLLAVTPAERTQLASRPGVVELRHFREGSAESAIFRVR